jgi:hypothetical protein
MVQDFFKKGKMIDVHLLSPAKGSKPFSSMLRRQGMVKQATCYDFFLAYLTGLFFDLRGGRLEEPQNNPFGIGIQTGPPPARGSALYHVQTPRPRLPPPPKVSTPGVRFTTTQLLFPLFSAIDCSPAMIRRFKGLPTFPPVFSFTSGFALNRSVDVQSIVKHVLHERPFP